MSTIGSSYECPFEECGAAITAMDEHLPSAPWPDGDDGASFPERVAAHSEATMRLRAGIIEQMLVEHLDAAHPGWTYEAVADATRRAYSKEYDDNRREVEALIRAGLRSCIATHGPITLELVDSAAKRVYGELLADRRLV